MFLLFSSISLVILLPMVGFKIPSRAADRCAWVIYQLKLRDSSLAAIARKHGWTRRAIRGAMFEASYPQEKALAEELDIPIETLFPERYDADGNRRHAIRSRKHSGPRMARHRQKSEVA